MYPFEQLVNFRDMGGIVTKDGKTVQKKRILRSGNLTTLSENDIKVLSEDYQVVNIIDLRTKGELDIYPSKIIPNAHYYHIDIMEGQSINTGKDDLEKIKDADDSIAMMKEMYRTIMRSPHALTGYRKLIDILLNTPKGATLFHCFAGKDRTGIAAAIIYTLLGVDYETILNDYLLTNESRLEHLQMRVKDLRDSGASEKEVTHLKVVMGVLQEYIETAYEVATELYGSFYNYITEGIGVSEEEVAKLKELYTE